MTKPVNRAAFPESYERELRYGLTRVVPEITGFMRWMWERNPVGVSYLFRERATGSGIPRSPIDRIGWLLDRPAEKGLTPQRARALRQKVLRTALDDRSPLRQLSRLAASVDRNTATAYLRRWDTVVKSGIPISEAPAAVESAEAWFSSRFDKINSALRHQRMSPALKDDLRFDPKHLDRLISANKKKAGTVWRGVSLKRNPALQRLRIGDIRGRGVVLRDRSYLAASSNPAVADSFREGGVVFRIRGAHGWKVPEDVFKEYMTEEEVLMPRGSALRVTGIRLTNTFTTTGVQHVMRHYRNARPAEDKDFRDDFSGRKVHTIDGLLQASNYLRRVVLDAEYIPPGGPVRVKASVRRGKRVKAHMRKKSRR